MLNWLPEKSQNKDIFIIGAGPSVKALSRD